MKYIIPIILLIVLIPIGFAETAIATMDGYWVLTGEITNANPYTVFVAVPDNIDYTDKTLKSSNDFLKVSLSGNIVDNPDGTVFYNTILNGKRGFWIPPYTTVKISREGILNYTLNIDESQVNYDIAGLALVDTTKILNLKQVFPIYQKGIMLDNFKLYVRGSIIKSDNSEVISIIVPAPLVLDNYYQFNKIFGKYDVDIWVSSYNEYINKHKKTAYKQNPELYNIDDALVPNMDDSFGSGVNLKLFDVPAMAFTTSDKQPIDFAYVMYWDKKYN